MLKQSFDTIVGAMYLQIDDRPVERTIEVSSTVFVDLAADGRPVGLEVLGLSQEQPLIDREELAAAMETYEFPVEARLLLAAAVAPGRADSRTGGHSQEAQPV